MTKRLVVEDFRLKGTEDKTVSISSLLDGVFEIVARDIGPFSTGTVEVLLSKKDTEKLVKFLQEALNEE